MKELQLIVLNQLEKFFLSVRKVFSLEPHAKMYTWIYRKEYSSRFLFYVGRISKSTALLIVRYETAVPANRETRLLSLAMERVGTLGLAKQFAF